MKGSLFVLTGLMMTGFAAKDNLHYKGTASDLQSGQFYYTEEYEELQAGNHVTETLITYKDDSKSVIVKKKIDYSKSAIHPDFSLEDLRDGYLEGSKTENGITELMFRKNKKRSIEIKKIRIPEPAVIDGGFTNFVKDHWDQLQSGEKISFNFAVPSELDYYGFRMSRMQEITFAGKHAVMFKMELDQPILRALFPAILLTYSMSSKRLMQYEGISNINDKKGKSYHVRIVYPTAGP